jgi:hypothetical protein
LPKLVFPADGATNVPATLGGMNHRFTLVFDFFQNPVGNWQGPILSPPVTLVGPWVGPITPAPSGALEYDVTFSGFASKTTYKVGFAPPSTAWCDVRPVIFIGSFTTF